MRFGLKIILSILCFLPFALADVDIVDAGAGIEFVDLGLDPSTGNITLVGTEDVAGTPTAKVYYLSADRTILNSEELIGLGPDTQVFGIASDGSRVAGASAEVGEGLTWLSSAPDSPTGIGFVSGSANNSAAIGAWSGGVVGEHAGLSDAVTWTSLGGLIVLPDGGTLAEAGDVSADGLVISGFVGGLPAYWDTSGFLLLENPGGNTGAARAISPNATHMGGGIDFLDFIPVFDAGTQAAVWTKVGLDYQVTLLTNTDGSRFKGEVLDVSNAGYAVGATSDGRGFIWHSSFDGVQSVDEWLLETQNIVLPKPSGAIIAITEDVVKGQLVMALQEPAIILSVDTILSILPGDFDEDGSISIHDLNLLEATTRSMQYNYRFDLNSDGILSLDDLQTFVHDSSMLNSFFGDSNLDGEFNSTDLISAFQAGKYETEMVADWQDGDWNLDGVFNSGDLIIAFQDGGYERGPRISFAVPESNAALFCVVLSLFMIRGFKLRTMSN